MIKNSLCLILDIARNRQSYKRLKGLFPLEYLTKRQIELFQQERLFSLLQHAYEHVPYYRKLWNQMKIVNTHGKVDLDRLANIPILHKESLRIHWENLKSDDLHNRKWKYNQTGGSTGEPVEFIQDQEYHDYLMAVKDHFDIWTGCYPGHKKVLLWGSEKDFTGGKQTSRVKFSRWLRNQLWLSTFRMTPENMENYVKSINAFRPDQILGYVGSLYEFALFIKLRKIQVYSPRSIMSTAGTLDAQMREVIEEVFCAPVFDRYGSREVGDIACECEKHKGLHVCPATNYVEIVRPNGSLAGFGEEGDIVVTSLTNYSMPMIRYKIGDRGVMTGQACSCKRAWPLLEKISGRSSDSFIKKDGGLVSGETFIILFYPNILRPNQNQVRRFQIIQEDFESVRIKLVLFPEFASETSCLLKKIENGVKTVMGSDCQVNFDIVEDIPPSPSGKHRFVYSLINR